MSVVTIERHIIESQSNFPDASGNLTKILTDISLATKIIAKKVNKAGLVNILGQAGLTNIQGEQVTKLDIFANEILVETLTASRTLCLLASEENDDVIEVPEQFGYGDYVVCFDPLDGSGNIDANVSVGTIFAVYRRSSASGPGTVDDLLRRGSEQVAAGYVIYGSSNMLVYSVGNGVHGFTLDPGIGEYVLSHENIQTPKRGKIYSVNEGNYAHFEEPVKKYIKHLQEVDEESGRPYSSRYIGSFVADFHRNLLYGGIFIYPATAKNPNGKLRYLYEAAPLAFICEQAGGAATNGRERILDIRANDIHMRTPLVIGSAEDVELFGDYCTGKA